ncbi:hypothetical protein Glove_991g2 [Diversispora epigaea]|uniref:Uncharacterized protein n=1 Tax=Diversispora epigaea TaxID=1348612 RepID=A0A397G2P8_9GLOM|nr:hypothetical protein Glove_991g2 [Diversispora epigaea]
MAASKPISWLYSLNTSLLSLNKNFGTLNTFQHSSLPFREQILANRVFTTPPYAQGITYPMDINAQIVRDYSSVPAMISLDIFATITHSAFYKPDHGKITTLRVSI